MLERLPIVGVMGSHEEEWEDYADPVGDLLARRGYHLLTGAGGGVMTVVARAFTHVKKRKGRAIGILPTADYQGERLSEKEYPNPHIEIPMVVPLSPKAQSATMPFSRNLVNIMTSDALIVLPGSIGTKTEVSFGIQWGKPLILFGPDKAFAGFPSEPLRADDIKHVAQFLDDVFGASDEK